MIQTVTFCIANAENHDQNVSQEWQQLLTDQTKQNQRLLQKLIEWQNQAELYLQQAKETIKKMGFPFPDQHKNN